MKEKFFEAWMEGFQIQGMLAPQKASLYGRAKAISFEAACQKMARQKGDKDYDAKSNKSWGCKLYPTEAEARNNIFG